MMVAIGAALRPHTSPRHEMLQVVAVGYRNSAVPESSSVRETVKPQLHGATTGGLHSTKSIQEKRRRGSEMGLRSHRSLTGGWWGTTTPGLSGRAAGLSLGEEKGAPVSSTEGCKTDTGVGLGRRVGQPASTGGLVKLRRCGYSTPNVETTWSGKLLPTPWTCGRGGEGVPTSVCPGLESWLLHKAVETLSVVCILLFSLYPCDEWGS